MSLGGYKFAGKYCEKGSLTDAQWALLVHKTRLAAFMASNTLSNAGWSFDQTGGDIAFESYGNVIYSLDSVGNNYVSFVKHGTESPTYIAIITTFKWGQSTGTGQIDGPWQLKYRGITSSADTQYFCSGNSLYHRLSSVRLTTSNLFTPISDATPLMACGNAMHMNNGYAGMSTSNYNSFVIASSFYAGYAIKNSMVICFSGRSISSNMIYTSIIAGGAYSRLYANNDTHNLFAFCFYGSYFGQSASSSYGEANPISDSDGIENAVAYAPDLNGNVHANTVLCPLDAYYRVTTTIGAYPYCSIKTLGAMDTYSNTYEKGAISVDLFCTNAPSSATSGMRYKTVANGNLIWIEQCASKTYNGDLATRETDFGASKTGYPQLYVGWDPSNPDITQASAWTEYTGT